jgi:hypothetical protein
MTPYPTRPFQAGALAGKIPSTGRWIFVAKQGQIYYYSIISDFYIEGSFRGSGRVMEVRGYDGYKGRGM